VTLGRLASLGLLAVAAAAPLDAQIGVVVRGRIEDAATGAPVEGMRVLTQDSSSVAYTDSVGAFVVVFRSDAPLAVHTEGIGYLRQRFELPSGAAARVNVLRVEPSPIEIAGIDVVTEQAITVIVERLTRRRRAYAHAMSFFDRAALERYGRSTTPYEIVRRRLPGARPCPADPYQLCADGRGGSFRNVDPVAEYLICVDGWQVDVPSLEIIPNEDVAILEIFKGGLKQIRVYTVRYLAFLARSEQTTVWPVEFGC
jgi:hypothetical protein